MNAGSIRVILVSFLSWCSASFECVMNMSPCMLRSFPIVMWQDDKGGKGTEEVCRQTIRSKSGGHSFKDPEIGFL